MPKEKEEEAEMLINPKAEEMCRFEEKRAYSNCSSCPRQIDDQIFCALSTMKWRLSNLEKKEDQHTIQNNAIIELLKKISEK